MADEGIHTGQCLCGAVRYRTTSPLRPVIMCHCVQCRRQTGHMMAATAVARSGMEISGEESLRWYRSSEGAERGFCGTCGSVLFWQADGRDSVSFTAGSLDQPTGLHIAMHIYCESMGDYYTIDGTAPQFPGDH